MTPPAPSAPATLAEARKLYRERAYQALVQRLKEVPPEALLAEPEVAFYYADASRRLGFTETALEITVRLADACSGRGEDRLRRDRLNLEGMLRFGRGEIVQARQLWSELLNVASRAGDEEFVARSNQNLGVVYTLGGSLDAALVSYERALTAYRRLGQWRGIAQALQNIAIIYRELGRWAEAERYCQDAIGYARQDGSEDEVARAQQERALVLCLQGDRLLAHATARLALDAWERLDQPSGKGVTAQVLGVIALAERRLSDARAQLARALVLARQTSEVLLEAETLETQATLETLEGRHPEAAELRAEAERLFSGLGAAGWGTRLRTRLHTLLSLPPPEVPG